MPVLMIGAMPVRTTASTSIPNGTPRKPSTGSVQVGCSDTVSWYISSVQVRASSASPPTRPTMAGAPAMANPPSPTVSVIAESPMSGLASAGPKPPRNSPSGTAAGPVNQRSPVPETRMPNSVPLRAMATTTLDPGTPAPASPTIFPAAMTTLSRKWSLASMKESTSATSSARRRPTSMVRTRSGASARTSRDVPARFRLWPSSPIVTIEAIRAPASTGPWRCSASARLGPSTSSIHRRRSVMSPPNAP
jgi:hypothetical protein